MHGVVHWELNCLTHTVQQRQQQGDMGCVHSAARSRLSKHRDNGDADSLNTTPQATDRGDISSKGFLGASDHGGMLEHEEAKTERGEWLRKSSKPNLAIALDDDVSMQFPQRGADSMGTSESERCCFADTLTPNHPPGPLRLRQSNYVKAVEDRLVKVRHE